VEEPTRDSNAPHQARRYTFGFVYLLDGISFVPVMVGLFAITELTSMILQGGTIAKSGRLEGSLWDGFWDTFRYPFTLVQSTAVGAFLGMIPGIGATAANFLAYSVAQRSSRHPEQFGKGAPEGVIALPGSYTIHLTVGGNTYTQPLHVVMDPRVRATTAQLRAQFDLASRVAALMNRTYGSPRYAALNAQLGQLLGDIESADAPPTVTQRAAVAAAEKQVTGAP